MRLTWTEIKINASAFTEEWRDAWYERGEAQSFYNDFFEIFGVRRRSVARFEEHVKKLGKKSGFIDVFWPGVLIAEHKSLGADLGQASRQADEYFDSLPEDERPRFKLVCDFQRFDLTDLETGENSSFTLQDLPANIEQFAFILGRQRPTHRINQPLNEKAAGYVAQLHHGLIGSGYPTEDAERLLVRLVFCMFADVTGIFQPRGLFLDLIDAKTKESGEDLGYVLAMLFQVLNTAEDRRQETLDPDLKVFPYINGDLFARPISVIASNKALRQLLLEAAQFDWSMISPAIFGALFQSVLSDEERAMLGSHATSEENILKVLNDLFLYDMWRELESSTRAGSGRIEKLKQLRERLSAIKVMDPACGCGNFLAVAYRELRRVELALVVALKNLRAFDPSVHPISMVDVDQFFGIELRASSAKIAEIAMWMTDHLMNNEFSLALKTVYSRIPLKSSPKIIVGDALKIDWDSVLQRSECSYIFGNPPYKGSKRQSVVERSLIQSLSGSSATLDYAAGWFFKAAQYINENAKVAFVAINSLAQGEQVGDFFPVLLRNFGLEIIFAHRSFSWDPIGGAGAQVDVIVVGLANKSKAPTKRQIYYYDESSHIPKYQVDCRSISPYLFPADNLNNPMAVVLEVNTPINGAGRLKTGSKPIDGGYFILSKEERDQMVARNPATESYIHPYVGAEEFLYGSERFIIYLGNDHASQYRNIKPLREIVAKVKEYRLARIPNKSGNSSLREPNDLASAPTRWHITNVPTAPFLIVPEVTSENREYIPIGWAEPPVIPSNLVKVLVGATLFDFALLTSAMHMAWVRCIGGRLEGRYRYSIGVIYNNFPRPYCPDRSKIEKLAENVLKARRSSGLTSLEAMYDPLNMPNLLKKSHQKLDAEVDKLYRLEEFSDDQDRFEVLMNLYTEMIQTR